MIKRLIFFLTIVIGAIPEPLMAQVQSDMKKIKGGIYVPLYGLDSSNVIVDDFYLDTYPVTNDEYRNYLLKNPSWRKTEVIQLFADQRYLNKWVNDTTFSHSFKGQSPITSISWFAAKAYCKSQGKRLPSVDEWEYAAMASENEPNAQLDSVFQQFIIEGYETPKTSLKEIGQSSPNYWGIHDLHAMVWEWTSDFNSVLISGESRKDVDTDRKLFCAGGSVNATALMNYAAFMRYAIRGSIKANYCMENMGFRCASDIIK